MIPYGRQAVSEDDIDAVVSVLRSDFLTQGQQVPAFEAAVADYCGARRAVAVSNATSALHIACLALELGPGDRLWTTPITFVASANCARYCGAEVDFVDIDRNSNNMSVEALAIKLADAERQDRLPKIVVPVHLAGRSACMREIKSLSQRYGFRIIEDASHAIGGRYAGSPVGSCEFSDIAIFSFHPVKIITTAEGGMALTNNERLAERMALLRSHGITRDKALMCNPDAPDWHYEQIDLGFNYRLSDLHAALGLSQLDRLNEFVSQRRRLADRYNELLAELPFTLPSRDPEAESAWHLYVARLKTDQSPKTQQQVFEDCRQAGIGVNLHYIPVHKQPYYQRLLPADTEYPESDRYYSEAITLPLYPDLSDRDQDYVAEQLRKSTT